MPGSCSPQEQPDGRTALNAVMYVRIPFGRIILHGASVQPTSHVSIADATSWGECVSEPLLAVTPISFWQESILAMSIAMLYEVAGVFSGR